MKLDSLGLNHFVLGSAISHAVTPLSSALSSAHLSAAPPHTSSSIPRCFLYHSRRALLSVFALKNTPPIPVIFATSRLLSHRLHCEADSLNRSAPIRWFYSIRI